MFQQGPIIPLPSTTRQPSRLKLPYQIQPKNQSRTQPYVQQLIKRYIQHTNITIKRYIQHINIMIMMEKKNPIIKYL
jgi:hypothetical protein